MQKDITKKTIEVEQDFLKPEEYFFSGSGEYVPVTVVASSIDEAIKKWEAIREPVTTGSSTPLQVKNVVE